MSDDRERRVQSAARELVVERLLDYLLAYALSRVPLDELDATVERMVEMVAKEDRPTIFSDREAVAWSDIAVEAERQIREKVQNAANIVRSVRR